MLVSEWPHEMAAPNVEPAGMHILGGLPVQGDELLASMSVNLEPQATEPEELLKQTLPLLGAPR